MTVMSYSEEAVKWRSISWALRRAYSERAVEALSKVEKARQALVDAAVRDPGMAYIRLWLEKALEELEEEITRPERELKKLWEKLEEQGISLYTLP